MSQKLERMLLHVWLLRGPRENAILLKNLVPPLSLRKHTK
jgi:hypothetical protein